MDIKVDRRVRRTKKLLLHGLTKLMMEKSINKISVTELTELADVNRSTFYLYYKDIYDMVEQIETEIIDEFQIELKKLYLTENVNDNLLAFFIFVFEFVRNNSDLCKILLGKDCDYSFLNKFTKIILDSQPPINHKMNGIGSQYFMSFLISGCIGAIQQWIEEDMKVPPKDIAVFVIDLITNGVNSLLVNYKVK